MNSIRVVGFDPSLTNWGVASGIYDLDSQILVVESLNVIRPVVSTGKQVRQNSKDLEAAQALANGALNALQDTEAVFVEIPVGSQSSRAMASYGLCVGILGGLRAQGIPFFEVTPTEVKKTVTGSKTATKGEMIHWATAAHPEAPWPTVTRNGVQEISWTKAEHMADAIGAIYAGLQTPVFQSMVPLLQRPLTNIS